MADSAYDGYGYGAGQDLVTVHWRLSRDLDRGEISGDQFLAAWRAAVRRHERSNRELLLRNIHRRSE
jgi:hypothetical protein